MYNDFMALLLKSTPTQWLVSFIVLAVTDVCWALYTKATAIGSPLASACWAVGLFVLGGGAVMGYISNPVLIIPSAFGAFVGTYIGTSFGKGK